MSDRTTFQRKIESSLAEWQAEAERLQARAAHVPAQNQLEFLNQIDLLDAKLGLAQERLERFKNADRFEWTELAASLDGIGREVQHALDSARAKIGRR